VSQTGAEKRRGPWTPAQAWAKLARGNERFVAGQYSHPHQDAARRDSLTGGQTPFAVFFGCADSRVAAEIIFDRGLGDLFVVRTAGHVIDPGVLGSIEFGVAVLDIPLVVILGHDSCGAVSATVNAVRDGVLPGGYIRDIVERVTPSVLAARQAGMSTPDEIEAEHVRHTLRLLTERSRLIGDRVDSGRLAVVGATYNLSDGRARIVDSVGLNPVPQTG
jgi:carbonic anhydrase